jgi:hypothetical protein
MTKGERNKYISDREREMTLGRDIDNRRGSIKFEHTSRGSKLINLNGAFECASHMYACIA